MENLNSLLLKIEAGRLWAYFHKDWLLSMRDLLRPQLPPQFFVFVESETCEVYSKYTLLIRRAPENHVVGILELLSPSNKGIGNRWDREKYLRKRNSLIEGGVNFLEIDALAAGERVLTNAVHRLTHFQRNAWTAFHHDGRRIWRGWGWNEDDPLPAIPWTIEPELAVLIDLADAMQQACRFNRWETLV